MLLWKNGTGKQLPVTHGNAAGDRTMLKAVYPLLSFCISLAYQTELKHCDYDKNLGGNVIAVQNENKGGGGGEFLQQGASLLFISSFSSFLLSFWAFETATNKMQIKISKKKKSG